MPVHIPGQRRRWHWTIRMYPSCTHHVPQGQRGPQALGLHPIRSELPPGCAVYDLLATDVGTTQLRRADGIVVLGQARRVVRRPAVKRRRSTELILR